MNEAQIKDIQEELFEDVGRAREDLDADRDDQYRRRNLVRVTAAAIEGWAYTLKQWALEAAEADPTLFTTAEINVLREIEYRLAENGVVHERSAKLQTVPNLRFAFLAVMRMSGMDAERINEWNSDVEMKEFWRDAVTVQHIRDRIVHPKTAAQLVISDAELEIIDGFFMLASTIPAVVLVVPFISSAISDWLGKHPRIAAAFKEAGRNMT